MDNLNISNTEYFLALYILIIWLVLINLAYKRYSWNWKYIIRAILMCTLIDIVNNLLCDYNHFYWYKDYMACYTGNPLGINNAYFMFIYTPSIIYFIIQFFLRLKIRKQIVLNNKERVIYYLWLAWIFYFIVYISPLFLLLLSYFHL